MTAQDSAGHSAERRRAMQDSAEQRRTVQDSEGQWRKVQVSAEKVQDNAESNNCTVQDCFAGNFRLRFRRDGQGI
jgi:hypothetical protein